MEEGGPGPGAAEVDAPKASPEARPQIPTKPQVPDKPQELASPPAGCPTPAPRKVSESTALTPPTPRPRSSLQPENSAEQGGGSGLVNGERLVFKHRERSRGHPGCLRVLRVGGACFCDC